MDITEDKIISKLIENLKAKSRKKIVSGNKDKTILAPLFIFVCGKAFKARQDSIRKYTIETLNKCTHKNFYGTEKNSVWCVISENLYTQDLAEDIFSFEKMLAEISDKIIIVAESPGTFCELGAFVMDEQCRAKTIVINEDKNNYKNSFITKGPIKMLENKNDQSVIRHYGLDRIKSSTEYGEKIEKIAQENFKLQLNNNSKEVELKTLIYELACIVELFQPLECSDAEILYKKIKGFIHYTITNTAEHKIRNIRQVLSLMESMELVKKQNGYYWLNKKVSCYNILFKISREEFNNFRMAYLNRLDKCDPQRMEICDEFKR